LHIKKDTLLDALGLSQASLPRAGLFNYLGDKENEKPTDLVIRLRSL
jgi:hypothetical protein